MCSSDLVVVVVVVVVVAVVAVVVKWGQCVGFCLCVGTEGGREAFSMLTVKDLGLGLGEESGDKMGISLPTSASPCTAPGTGGRHSGYAMVFPGQSLPSTVTLHRSHPANLNFPCSPNQTGSEGIHLTYEHESSSS